VKIPALEHIFQESFKDHTLENVSKRVYHITGNKDLSNLILKHTGFTNFYSAYRNSSLEWITDNFDQLYPLYQASYSAGSCDDRKIIIDNISKMKGIPKANHPSILMQPEYLLTPTFFMLDSEIKFPIINGKKSINSLLEKLKVKNKNLTNKYSAMTSLYGKKGLKDAADLDQLGTHIVDFLDTQAKSKKVLEKKDTKKELPLKDETDVLVIQKSNTIKYRRIHNELTNKLKNSLKSYSLFEGSEKDCMYDVLVNKFDKQHDLMIEVKSSNDIPNIRMAIGQLLNYWFKLYGNLEERYLAVLLPIQPSEDIINFFNTLKIGLLWFDNNNLKTNDDWLNHLTVN
jgi:hypothetical protein